MEISGHSLRLSRFAADTPTISAHTEGVGDPTMDDGSRLTWLIAVILLCAGAYFAVTETALASVSRIKIKAACDRGDPRAQKAL